MASRESMLLAELAEDGTFVVDSVSDRDARSLRQMKARGSGAGRAAAGEEEGGREGYSVRVGRSAKAFELSRGAAQDVRIVRPASKGAARVKR